jgi:hypothetical protein
MRMPELLDLEAAFDEMTPASSPLLESMMFCTLF